MANYIALLRAINVGGKNKIRMTDLKSLFVQLGLKDPRTYLQSGNVVFATEKSIKVDQAAANITQAIRKKLGHEVASLVLPAQELEHIAANNPFILKQGSDPSHCYVTFCFQAATEEALADTSKPNNETGSFEIDCKTIYLHCPDGYGRTKINNGFFEKKLKVPATTRNWKTLLALTDLGSK